MIKDQLFIGTGNKGKLKEFKFYIKHFKIFKNFKILDKSFLRDLGEPDENGNTFEKNAMIKSAFYFKKTNLPILSDDSGFILKNSNYFPGVRTARLANEQGGIQKAVDYIFKNKGLSEGIPITFFSSISYRDKNREIVVSGSISGELVKNPVGDYGFGFDPFFIPSGYKKTFGQMEPYQKNLLSHRHKAFSKLSTRIN